MEPVWYDLTQPRNPWSNPGLEKEIQYEREKSIYLSIYPFIYIYLSIYLSIYLAIYLSMFPGPTLDLKKEMFQMREKKSEMGCSHRL